MRAALAGIAVTALAIALPAPCRADPFAGTWEGQYRCGQTKAAAQVVIDPQASDGTFSGVFRFSSLPGQTTPPTGIYKFIGTVDPGKGALHAVPTTWVQSPPGYLAVGFILSRQGPSLAGWMETAGCGEIVLAIAPPPKPAPAPAPPPPPPKAQPAVALDDRTPCTSIAACNAIIQSDAETRPRRIAALSVRADLLSRQGEADAAIRDATQAVELAPEQSLYRARRGLIYADAEQTEAALADCTRAVSLDPKAPNAYTCLAYAHMQRHDPAAARTDLDHALAIAPRDTFALWLKAEVARRAGAAEPLPDVLPPGPLRLEAFDDELNRRAVRDYIEQRARQTGPQ